jgi:hypothetical protein
LNVIFILAVVSVRLVEGDAGLVGWRTRWGRERQLSEANSRNVGENQSDGEREQAANLWWAGRLLAEGDGKRL